MIAPFIMIKNGRTQTTISFGETLPINQENWISETVEAPKKIVLFFEVTIR